VRSLATPSFVWHFRQNDTAAVVAVASQIEVLYTTLRRNVGLPRTSYPDQHFDAEKLAIDVTVAQSPGTAASLQHLDDRFVVPSPAIYLAPVELTDTELLAQSLALPLIDEVLIQASIQHGIGETWQPLLDGLRLWQVWNLDLPLAAWRETIVQWIYVDVPAVGLGQPYVLPDGYPALCAAYQLWMASPAQLHIPLMCARPEWEEQSSPLWRLRDPLTRLDQFAVPVGPGEDLMQANRRDRFNQPGQAIALATLIEYAAATYGRERLPVLVAGLGHYASWETLLAAVFGVSAAEFEAGWQAYLTAHYGVPTHQ
jgi:hypothetical protein